MKKICYLFVFDGFADYEVCAAAAEICNSDVYQLKTIAISKEPVRAASGITVMPDLDFFPETDLDDIDHDNTAILILPGGRSEMIKPLVSHCLMLDIPIVGNAQHALEILHILPALPVELI